MLEIDVSRIYDSVIEYVYGYRVSSAYTSTLTRVRLPGINSWFVSTNLTPILHSVVTKSRLTLYIKQPLVEAGAFQQK